MKWAANLNSRNKVTIPAEVRKVLGLRAGESVVFDIVADRNIPEVRLRRSPNLDELTVSMPAPDEVRSLSWEQIRYRAWIPSGDYE